jgi:glycerol-3-phosphate dehydrogenase (NAD(P)+)
MSVSRRNPRYLSEFELPARVSVTHDLGSLSGIRIVLVVVPSHGFREVLHSFLEADQSSDELLVISGTKGIERDTLARMSQVCFEEGLSRHRGVHFAVVSGPSFASELVSGVPTASVVASEEAELAEQVRNLFSANNLRLYSTSDVVGVEIGGTAKNVIAIAAGAAVGLGYGHNTLAALMTRGLHEVTRLGMACGGRQRTFSGLAGMGDLVLTCTGGESRNRRTGLELAQGKTLEQIEAETSMVAEGVLNSLALRQLARDRGVDMPITRQMVEVLYNGKPPRDAVEELMARDLKSESEL